MIILKVNIEWRSPDPLIQLLIVRLIWTNCPRISNVHCLPNSRVWPWHLHIQVLFPELRDAHLAGSRNLLSWCRGRSPGQRARLTREQIHRIEAANAQILLWISQMVDRSFGPLYWRKLQLDRWQTLHISALGSGGALRPSQGQQGGLRCYNRWPALGAMEGWLLFTPSPFHLQNQR